MAAEDAVEKAVSMAGPIAGNSGQGLTRPTNRISSGTATNT